jgi:hypothetical protein
MRGELDAVAAGFALLPVVQALSFIRWNAGGTQQEPITPTAALTAMGGLSTAAAASTYVPLAGGSLTGPIDDASAAPASAGTLPVTGGNFLQPTGTTTITALGTAQAGALRSIRFTTSITLTHNGTNLILPGALSIAAVSGDIAHFRSLGSGNWLLVGFQRGDGSLFELKATDIASSTIVATPSTFAATIGNYVVITNASGTNTITALGTAPAGVRKQVTFSIASGTLNLTCNTTSLILPGTVNGGTLSLSDGDSAVFHSLGSGNWRMTTYQKNSLVSQLWVIQNKSANYPVVTADKGTYFMYTQASDVTLSLPAAASNTNFVFGVSNRGTAGTKITIDPNGGELIDGLATTDLYPGSATSYICDGTGWKRMETGVIASAPTFVNNQIFNSSGTWTVPAGVYTARFTVIGGGGGGAGGGTGTNGGTGGSASISGTAGTFTGNGGSGGVTAGVGGAGGTGSGGTTNITGGTGGDRYSGSGSGGGGGGGGFTSKTVTVVPGDVYTITINAVATGGTASNTGGTGGGGGGASAAGKTGGANGGSAGLSAIGGAGAAGSTGAGGAGGTSNSVPGAPGTASTPPESGGGGGGGHGSATGAGRDGGAGAAVGAGGGGGGVSSGSTGGAGGAGGKGGVFVEW